MKTLGTIVALTGFMFISLFGLLSISHGGGHMAECLASRLNGSSAPCPQVDPVGFASFHSDALKKISNLIIVDGAAALYLTALSILLMFGAMLFLGFNKLSLSRIRSSEFELLATSRLPQATKLSWLALHEKRDPASVF